VPRRKRKQYAVEVDRAGRAAVDGGRARDLGDEWTPEHLVLAALAKCVLLSLDYHGRRDELNVAATARAAGAVFERADGSWGFVELRSRVEATVEPAPDEEALSALVARAERGCFVGASFDPRPAYAWTINGAEVG
jgi:organic hydroperoxide reductase OsmC/OhrA